MPNHVHSATKTNSGIKVPANSSALSKAETKLVIERITDCAGNIFKSIKNLFSSIFYRIFYCKEPPSDAERQYAVFSARKERAGSLSDELAAKEANEFPIVYTRLGKEIFNGSYNPFWKVSVCVPLLGRATYYEIGKKYALNNPKALLPHLKNYYESEITRLEYQIKRG